MLRTATVFAPGHLTGLFQICDQDPDPLKKGARGSGISLELGTITKVIAKPSSKNSYNVFINGQLYDEPVISNYVIEYYLNLLRNPVSISVEHLVQTPITAGFGSSGGGALSLSLALNQVLETGYDRLEAAQIAHIAEIVCKTGLGSVYAAEVGGFGVLTKPGAPGIGESFSFKESRDYRVIFVYYGSIPTKDALSNPDLRKRVNQLGGKFVDMLIENFTPERFLRLSREFTEYVDIVTPRLWKLFDYMDQEGSTFTMAMFGEVAFTVQHVDLVDDVLFSLSKISDSVPVVCKIDEDGARFL
jgi:pantoate kinase